jgi:hypothetical protein
MNSMIKKVIDTLVFLILFLSINSAFAGGGEYESADDTGQSGPAYFGFIREDKGSNIANAKVILKAKNGEKVELKSNILGVYRSHFNKDTKPTDVELLCEKPGFKQIRTLNRASSAGKYIETDCIMQKN